MPEPNTSDCYRTRPAEPVDREAMPQHDWKQNQPGRREAQSRQVRRGQSCCYAKPHDYQPASPYRDSDDCAAGTDDELTNCGRRIDRLICLSRHDWYPRRERSRIISYGENDFSIEKYRLNLLWI